MVALMDTYCGCYMAQTSNNLARDYGISPPGAGRVRASSPSSGPARPGRPAGSREEVVPVTWARASGPSRSSRDDHMRPETTMEDLAGLPTAFDKDGFVTAGNASGIVDGAAMMLLSTAEKAQERGWKPLGRILSWATVGVDPSRMGIGPAPAIRKALEQGRHGPGRRGPLRDQRGLRRPDPGGDPGS